MTEMKMMQLCFNIHSGERVSDLHDTLVDDDEDDTQI